MLLILPTTSLNAGEENKTFDAVIGLYQEMKNSISQYFIKTFSDEDLNLGLQMEQPLTNKGLNFVCYNECKERNDPTFCRQKCLNQ
ncbi:MAG: hypothetical protein CMI55_01465 [Parcubacteria group bacterium]|mgnify:FL=1|jgi:hypothetical protein|nr:hypothetical protein [Parcubacteria group bacterium]